MKPEFKSEILALVTDQVWAVVEPTLKDYKSKIELLERRVHSLEEIVASKTISDRKAKSNKECGVCYKPLNKCEFKGEHPKGCSECNAPVGKPHSSKCSNK